MGKLIVVDGIDGSGKSTQTSLLHAELAKQGRRVWLASFPNYESRTGELINMYLHGEFGTKPEDVNTYVASSLFSLDRYFAFSQTFNNFYKESDSIIISSRYTTSNIIHQMSKLPREEWDKYLTWLENYEYNLLGLPRPDKVYFLDLKPELSESLVEHRSEETGVSKDIHEKDVEYMEKCYRAGVYASDKLGWKRIPCYNENGLLSIDQIHNQLMEEIIVFLDTKGE